MALRRYNSSNGYRVSSNYIGPEGELTWDNNNGLRLHDGSTAGGNPFSVTIGNTGVHSALGSSDSSDDGKFLQQYSTNNSQWTWGVQLWKSTFNTSNPEVTVPGLAIAYYNNEVRLVNTSGSDASFTWAGRKITSSSVESLHSSGNVIVSTEFNTITSLAAGRGDTVILDHVCNVDQNVVYRATIMAGWSLTTYGQIVVEKLM